MAEVTLSAVTLCPSNSPVSPMDALETALSREVSSAGVEFVPGTLVFFALSKTEAEGILGMPLPPKTTLWQGSVLTRPR